MPSRISQIAIPANAAWKITNDASKEALLDAALRLVVSGGDQVPGLSRHQEKKITKQCSSLINLRTNSEIGSKAPVRFAPVANFGDFCVVDRDEIEGYRSLQQLLRDYLAKDAHRQSNSGKPLSIAVFGPPGSGKSFGIKKVATTALNRAATGNKPYEPCLDINLAQFSEPNQLSSAFLRIRNEGTGKRVPIAIFDEFDCSLAGNELGWLRYFLSPMQDGEFFYEGERQKIGKAVLVFAGGTSPSFRKFAREDGNDAERGMFVQAKGPDFVSRLSSYIDVLGVNKTDENADADQAYILRRATIIRSELKEQKLIGSSGRALVDEEFLRKLLEAGRYKHGARSIVQVLKMCVGGNGSLHLPPAEKLTIHLYSSDAEKLLS